MLVKNQAGQAVIEYMLIFIFIVLVLTKVLSATNDFFTDSIGNLGHVLGANLKVGVCNTNCFFSGYKNGYGK